MAKKQKMDEHERYRLKEIRLASKRGRQLTREEMSFCEQMFAKDPDSYVAMNAEITAEVRKDFQFGGG